VRENKIDTKEKREREINKESMHARKTTKQRACKRGSEVKRERGKDKVHHFA